MYAMLWFYVDIWPTRARINALSLSSKNGLDTGPMRGFVSASQRLCSGKAPVWKYLRIALAVHTDGAEAEVCYLH